MLLFVAVCVVSFVALVLLYQKLLRHETDLSALRKAHLDLLCDLEASKHARAKEQSQIEHSIHEHEQIARLQIEQATTQGVLRVQKAVESLIESCVARLTEISAGSQKTTSALCEEVQSMISKTKQEMTSFSSQIEHSLALAQEDAQMCAQTKLKIETLAADFAEQKLSSKSMSNQNSKPTRGQYHSSPVETEQRSACFQNVQEELEAIRSSVSELARQFVGTGAQFLHDTSARFEEIDRAIGPLMGTVNALAASLGHSKLEWAVSEQRLDCICSLAETAEKRSREALEVSRSTQQLCQHRSALYMQAADAANARLDSSLTLLQEQLACISNSTQLKEQELAILDLQRQISIMNGQDRREQQQQLSIQKLANVFEGDEKRDSGVDSRLSRLESQAGEIELEIRALKEAGTADLVHNVRVLFDSVTTACNENRSNSIALGSHAHQLSDITNALKDQERRIHWIHKQVIEFEREGAGVHEALVMISKLEEKMQESMTKADNLVCFNCKQAGHRSAQCKAPCQYCGQLSHWSGNCPQARLK